MAPPSRIPDWTRSLADALRERPLAQSLVAGMAAILVFWFLVIPTPWTLRTRDPERTALQAQRIREARRAGDTLRIRQVWVPLEEISPRMVRALLVAEDYRFREHRGIDWVSLAEEVRWTGDDDFSWASPADLRALLGALSYVRAHRSEIRGRSTLTQQLAKNLYFGTDRSMVRKGLEFVVAGRIEDRLDKDRILEIYLNVVEWGPGLFGVEAAAQEYFGRSAADLSLDQAAALAATLPHPLTSNPGRNPGRMLWRKNLLLGRLTAPSDIPPAPMPLPEVELALPPPDTGGLSAVQAVERPDTLGSPPDTLSPGNGGGAGAGGHGP